MKFKLTLFYISNFFKEFIGTHAVQMIEISKSNERFIEWLSIETSILGWQSGESFGEIEETYLIVI
jgi:hypothetical protein